MAALSLVRPRVRTLLESSPAYRALPEDKRRRIAHDTVRVAAYLADPDGLVSREFRAPLLRAGSSSRASGARAVRLGQTLDGGTTALDALVYDVDFPAFVAGLINGVFNALVSASIRQMEAYAELVAGVAASVDAFMSDAISDQAARDTLAAEFPELFCRTKRAKAALAWRADLAPAARLRLQAALGSRTLGTDLRVVVAAARRRLARNRQQTLAIVVLMGINRIVVTDGKITARIRFDLTRRAGRAAA
jgi:hypothetical protein